MVLYNMETAVEWYAKQMQSKEQFTQEEFDSITNQAKEMEEQETIEEVAERYYEDEVSINAFINGYKLAKEEVCNHNYILTSEQGHRIIKCSKCNNTQPI